MVLSVDIDEAGYDKESIVLKEIKFTVKAGELVGLIGPNGAGKSSAIKSILGIMNHVKGSVELTPYSYIPERPIIYDGLTLWEHIDFLLATSDIEKKRGIEKANELLRLFQLSHVKHHLPGSFSKGMQQKVMLIIAFLKPSNLYIIDEPFMGLDPKAIKKLLELLQKEREHGSGILMSTHALDTAEKICDRFVLISGGRLVIKGTFEEIRQRSGLPDGSLLDCFDVLTNGVGDVR